MKRTFSPQVIVAIVVIVGFSLSLLTGWVVKSMEINATINEFQKEVNQRSFSLVKEFSTHSEIANSISILFKHKDIPSYDEFNDIAMQIIDKYPAIYSINWLPKVTHQERAQFEIDAKTIHKNFIITDRFDNRVSKEAAPKTEYFPIYYHTPKDRNEMLIGFDLNSSSKQKKMLKLAAKKSEILVTESMLLNEAGIQFQGVLSIQPIYESQKREDKKSLLGYLVVAYKVIEIFNLSMQSTQPHGIHLSLLDQTETDKTSLLHKHVSRTKALKDEDISYQKNLPLIGGRKWTLHAQPTNTYIADRATILPSILLLTGMLFTLFLALYLHQINKQTYVVKLQVISKTKELRNKNKQLRALTQIDPLTGIGNRRAMDVYLEREWLRAIRNKTAISFIIFDIDYFKMFNDTYGHVEGDRILKVVAKTLGENAKRPGDLVARYGGEEFAVILTHTESVEKVAEDCRAAILALAIENKHSTVNEFLTISGGCSTTFPQLEDDLKLLINLADKALYSAKSQGRNRIVATQG